MEETKIKVMFIGNNKVWTVIMCVKLNVKFIGREQVNEWLDHSKQ